MFVCLRFDIMVLCNVVASTLVSLRQDFIRGPSCPRMLLMGMSGGLNHLAGSHWLKGVLVILLVHDMMVL